MVRIFLSAIMDLDSYTSDIAEVGQAGDDGIDRVRIEQGDSATSPYGWGTSGSRSVAQGGSASHAVAKKVAGGEYCIMALDPTASRAAEFSGNANVSLGCGVIANSNAPDALGYFRVYRQP